MALRAVFFDAGNTILELDYEVIVDRIRAHGHAVPTARIRLAEQHARVQLDPHLARGRSTEAVDVFQLYLRYLLDHLGITVSAGPATLAEELWRATSPYGLWSVPAPEAPAVLDGLRRRGLALAVVSNSNGTVAEALRAAGLADRVDAIVDSAVVGAEKPDPRIFAHAAAAVGVRPEDAVHVGDLYAVDVLGARAAGCRAILLDPAGAWPPLDCPTAPDLPAAARLIAALP
jgi:HAD superfamily hydrolase (TIGR01509 family)